MDAALLLTFWGAAALLMLVPGPDWAFILGVGASGRRVVPSVLGLMIGYTLMTGMVALGLAALLTAVPQAMSAITALGAAYLVFLGVTGFLKRGHSPEQLADPSALSEPERAWRPMLQGIGVSSLNPKGLLVFVALLPQFTDPNGAWSLPLQLGTLGIAFVLTCGVFYLALGFGARRILGSHPGLSAATAKVSSAIMIVLGGLLLAEMFLSR
ncbi:LysE family translocator [Leucobacter sp. M11]|uniref:LysE family translocator n=1 Tax=Leucobacter sp. M11 TaxID=2993565 RepID=UPI002D7F0EEC|nr:LysE family translocator [Leucobacter sp. M11]MEB4616289.1 LysE family translocator [Leucobacter sp. M11]